MVFSSMKAYGQYKQGSQQVVKKGARFLLDGEKYTYNKLRKLYLEEPAFKRISKKAYSQSVAGDVLVGVSLATITTVFAVGCYDLGCITSIFILIGATIPLTTGIIFKLSSTSKKKKSIDILNSILYEKSSDVSIRLGGAKHGLGLTISF